jgi:hypothetical protein
MKGSSIVVFWDGEAVGEMSEIWTETFHLSGRWAPRDSPKTLSFLRCFEAPDPEVLVDLGDSTNCMKGRMYEEPTDFIEINIIPSAPIGIRPPLGVGSKEQVMRDVCWDPPLPRDWQDCEWYALLLCPLSEISFNQLRELSKVFIFHTENLLSLRRRLCDGKCHLVATRLSPAQLEAVVSVLDIIKIPYEVIPADRAKSPSIASGLRSNFEY